MVWRTDAVASAVQQLEAEVRDAWVAFLAGWGVPAGSADELGLAGEVVADPGEHPWRVVDGALDRLTCPDCRERLGSGPVGCESCGFHDRMRFGAREVDRPGVVPGNEHALRVSFAVARNRHRYSPRARVGYELALPGLLTGGLPTTAEAQAAKALINRLTPDDRSRRARAGRRAGHGRGHGAG